MGVLNVGAGQSLLPFTFKTFCIVASGSWTSMASLTVRKKLMKEIYWQSPEINESAEGTELRIRQSRSCSVSVTHVNNNCKMPDHGIRLNLGKAPPCGC